MNRFVLVLLCIMLSTCGLYAEETIEAFQRRVMTYKDSPIWTYYHADPTSVASFLAVDRTKWNSHGYWFVWRMQLPRMQGDQTISSWIEKLAVDCNRMLSASNVTYYYQGENKVDTQEGNAKGSWQWEESIPGSYGDKDIRGLCSYLTTGKWSSPTPPPSTEPPPPIGPHI